MNLKITSLAFWAIASGLFSAHALEVTDVTARQRWPWNNLVDIEFTVVTNGTEATPEFGLNITGTYANGMKAVTASTFASDPYAAAGTNRVTWNLGADCPGLRTTDLALTVTVSDLAASSPAYLVINLSDGSTATSYPVRYTTQAPDLSNDTCRTDELWLRRIPAGTFAMGSPGGELGHQADEVQHSVTLTKGFYIGVFEVTQKQWFDVMGNRPSWYTNLLYRDTRPVEQVSHNDIRGTADGMNWPASSAVDATSFIGKLRTKTGITSFDLPTEAQWERACRAETTTSLNNGTNLTNTGSDSTLNTLARYLYTGGKMGAATDPGQNSMDTNATAKVGSYLPNAWGLYDMHGNVWERCLDRYTNNLGTASTQNPCGPATGSDRVSVGGGCWDDAQGCRSARRLSYAPDLRHARQGLRLARSLP